MFYTVWHYAYFNFQCYAIIYLHVFKNVSCFLFKVYCMDPFFLHKLVSFLINSYLYISSYRRTYRPTICKLQMIIYNYKQINAFTTNSSAKDKRYALRFPSQFDSSIHQFLANLFIHTSFEPLNNTQERCQAREILLNSLTMRQIIPVLLSRCSVIESKWGRGG